MARKLYDEDGNEVIIVERKDPDNTALGCATLIVIILLFFAYRTVKNFFASSDTYEDPTSVISEKVYSNPVEQAAHDILKDYFVDIEWYPEDNPARYNVYAKTAEFSASADLKSALTRSSDFLKEIQDVPLESVFIRFEATFIDQYGSSSRGKAIDIEVLKETIDKIDFEYFNQLNLPEVADSYWQHPAYD